MMTIRIRDGEQSKRFLDILNFPFVIPAFREDDKRID